MDSLLTNGADHSLFSRFRVDRPQWRDHGDYNTLIVTHGLTMRLMLMRYFQMSVGTYETMWNCRNCNFWVLKKDEVSQCYKLCAKESDPKRYPWATREATVISTKKSTRRARKVTVVDYLSIKQPRTQHVQDALERMVQGHDIHHINRKRVIKTMDGRHVLREEGVDDIPFLEWEDDMHHDIDWYGSSRDDVYPPDNTLSKEARDLRLNKRLLVEKRSTPIVLGVPTPKNNRSNTMDSMDSPTDMPPKIHLKVMRSVKVTGSPTDD